MGDRALIVFTEEEIIDGKKETRFSPVTYLHQSGYQVTKLLGKTREVMESRGADINYAPARFVGVCHEHIGGNLSLGVWNLPDGFATWTDAEKIDYSHGDHGLFVVDVETWKFKQYGEFPDCKLKQLPVKLKFHSTDTGYCRVYFKHPFNSSLYCWQDGGRGVGFEFLVCTSEGEPSHPVEVSAYCFPDFPQEWDIEKELKAKINLLKSL